MDIGVKIKELRQRKNISVDDIASKLGVSRQLIYKYESGTQPPLDKLKLLSEIFEVDISELLEQNSNSILIDRESYYWKDMYNSSQNQVLNLLKDIEFLREQIKFDRDLLVKQ